MNRKNLGLGLLLGISAHLEFRNWQAYTQKLMKIVWKFLVSTLIALLSLGEAHAETMVLSGELVDQIGGKEWKGILFVCDPYCRFVSIRESSAFNPVLTGEEVEKSAINLISEKDPIYPLLIVQSPVFPYLSQRLKNSDLVKRERDASIPPAFATMPFNYAWSLGSGLKAQVLTIKSDTSVQSDMSAQGMFPALTFEAGFMKGSPNKIWKFWLQHMLHFSMDMGGSYATADGSKVTTTNMELKYQMWSAQKDFKTGPSFTFNTEGYALPEDTIAHFSTNQTMMLLGWSLLWRRWNFSIDTAMSGNIHDSQEFRSGPFDQQFYRFGFNYCSRDVSVFGIEFGMCGGVTHKMDTQNSKVATNVIVTDTTKIDRNTSSVKFLIRVGEDFFK